MKKIVFLIAFSTSICASAQVNNGNGPGAVDSTKFMLPFDTVLDISAYYRLTDFSSDTFGILTMGSQGDVRRSLFYDKASDFFPNLGMKGYFNNFLTATHIPIYQTKVPLGGIRLLNGYNSGQMFGLYFTMSPNKQSSFYIDYQRINAQGNYLNQANTSDKLLISSGLRSKDGHYSGIFKTSWTKFQNGEFGGITNLSAFEADSVVSRALLDVKLTQSFSKAMQLDIVLNQKYDFLRVDSGTSVNVFYDFQIQNTYKTFSSLDSFYLQRSIDDVTQVLDSLRILNLNSFAGFQFDFGDKRHLLRAGILHTFFRYGNDNQLQTENLLGLKGVMAGKIANFDYDAYGQFWLTGDYAGTYEVLGSLGLPVLKSKIKLRLFAQNGLYRPGAFYSRYVSGISFWDNQLKSISETKLSGSLSGKYWEIGASSMVIGNYVFLDKNLTPLQESNALAIFSVDAAANLKLIGNFYLDNRIRYQTNTNRNLIRLPDWILRHALYYKKELFNNELKTQTGIEFQYFSNFSSEGYDPATSVMYLQDEYSIGNFPYFNVFTQLRIKQFTLLLKIENVTQGLTNPMFLAAPNYPMPDFRFRFGATWNFFN